MHFACTKTFSYILNNIGLNIFDIEIFSKRNPKYFIEEAILGSNSSWNILEIKGSYYIIFPSTYLLNIEEKELIDFYFCSKPELFIWTFLPKAPKWQLLEKSITKEEFQKRAKLDDLFFKYFDSIEPIYSSLTVEKRFTIRLNKKNQKSRILCKIMGMVVKNKFDGKGETYRDNLNCNCMVIDKED